MKQNKEPMKRNTLLKVMADFIVSFGNTRIDNKVFTEIEWYILNEFYHDAQEILHEHKYKIPWR